MSMTTCGEIACSAGFLGAIGVWLGYRRSTSADDEREVRRREQERDPLRARAAGHREGGRHRMDGNESELARSGRVAAAGDQDRPEPRGRRVARAPLRERKERV